ncbi:MAG TPA: hypothetical protein VG166_02955 [Caulobacteraceae bacterium]|nr:hypothetical protein [Caulobacteraceae bacterium]
MTTVTITGTIKNAYLLASPVTTLSIASSGYIEGNKNYGVHTSSAAASGYVVLNSGRIAGGVDGVVLFHGGTVTNGAGGATGALISAPTGVVIGAATGVVSNFATIKISNPKAGANSDIALDQGGTVTNGSSSDLTALLTSGAIGTTGSGTGVITERVASTVTNYGTIDMSAATYGNGVVLENGGLVTNGSSTDKTALIKAQHGIYVLGAPGTVVNFGVIDGGVFNVAGGAVSNGGATDTSASITGVRGVELLANYAPTVSLTNFGTVTGTAGEGVFGGTGVSVVNGSASDTAALIEGSSGVTIKAGSVQNFATIIGETTSTTATVYGGVLFTGTLINGSGADGTALIEGVSLGVRGSGTVTNFGTLEASAIGGDALSFTDSTSTLIAESGATFIGAVVVGASEIDAVAGLASFAAGIVSSGTILGAGTIALTGGLSTLSSGVKLLVTHFNLSGALTTVDVATNLSYSRAWTQTGGTVSVASGAILHFKGAADSFTGTLSGSGTIGFTAGADNLNNVTLSAAHASISGATVTLSGTIDLLDTLSVSTPHLVVASSGAVLSGGGTVLLSNLSSNVIEGASASAALVNVNDKITGAGQLGAGVMTLTNLALGVINAHDTAGLVINTGTNTVTNAGTIESTGAGGLSILSAVNNTGILAASVGTLSVTGAVSGGGSVRVSGGTALFSSTFTENVAFASTAGSVLELARSTAYTGQISHFSKTGASALDLLDIAFGAKTKATYSGTSASGVLTVTDGTHTAKIAFTGDYIASTFNVASDGHGGTTVTDPPAALISAIAAFAPDRRAQGAASASKDEFAPRLSLTHAP